VQPPRPAQQKGRSKQLGPPILTASCKWTRRWSWTSPARKAPESKVAGRATVLISPNFNAAISPAKLVQHVARANAYGQILPGPGSAGRRMSRAVPTPTTSSASAAIIGVQSIAISSFIPDAGKRMPGE